MERLVPDYHIPYHGTNAYEFIFGGSFDTTGIFNGLFCYHDNPILNVYTKGSRDEYIYQIIIGLMKKNIKDTS